MGTVDTRFPQLIEPEFWGLEIAPDGFEYLEFSIDVPPNIERSNYQGNAFLFEPGYHDIGTYHGRGSFIFKVS